MATQLGNTGVTFGDSSTQNTASNYRSTTYTANTTYVKPANLKAIRVTVVGGGGNGGSATGGVVPSGKVSYSSSSRGGPGGGGGTAVVWVDGSAIPSSPTGVAITVGAISGTSSFGPFASATGGTTGTASGSGQALSGGAGGVATVTPSPTIKATTVDGQAGSTAGSIGTGGAALLGSGGPGNVYGSAGAGDPAGGFGGGGGAGSRVGPGTNPGGAGKPGVVIVEEFF